VTRMRRAAVLPALVLVVATGCARTPPDLVESSSPTTSSTATSSPSTTSSATASAATASPVTEEDRQLVRAFVEFALAPGSESVGRVPFAADGVRLGLASDLVATVPAERLADPDSWLVDRLPHFRAYVGPFSALRSVRGHVSSAAGGDVLRRLQVNVGPHPHCASPPVPAPAAVQALRRVSVQPAEASITSCLEWFTVDLFVTPVGEVEAVTLDLYEP
jgi:hypothetical protein